MPEVQWINGAGIMPPADNLATAKRQRRPSVRLGEIGDVPAAMMFLFNRQAANSTKTRQLAKSGTGSSHRNQETLDLEDTGSDNLEIGNWRTKKCKSKRLKTGATSGGAVGDDHVDEESPLENSETQKRNSETRDEERNHNIHGNDEIQQDNNGGVEDWLNGLGLGRYRPVFEIHEVDEGVLPWLTMEDLKDMGVSAVGSRRKMFRAIQKLGKGFTSNQG